MPTSGGPGQQAMPKAIGAMPATPATCIATPVSCSPSNSCPTSDGTISNPKPVAASATAAKIVNHFILSLAPLDKKNRFDKFHRASDRKSRQALDEPERGHCSDRIGRDRQRVVFDDRREINTLGAGQQAKDGANKYKLSHLHTDVETEQRERDVPLWKSDFCESTGEAEAVQQAKGECHNPWPPRSQAPLAAPQADYLAGQQ